MYPMHLVIIILSELFRKARLLELFSFEVKETLAIPVLVSLLLFIYLFIHSFIHSFIYFSEDVDSTSER